ncbi:MAG TPA: hypothetical protein VHP61_09300 [Acidobacteriota bacterium]|nr:hypothetical protein [Acidobacteriota bacterium]
MRTGRLRAISALLLSAACAFASASRTRNAEARDIWQGWAFLMGDWVGTGTGRPGERTGDFAFRPELDGRILGRKNRVEYPARDGSGAGLVHEDLLIVYPAQGGPGFRAIYFDNEGHTIPYRVTLSPTGPSAVFESEGTAGEPRFRLSYEGSAGGDLVIVFSIAPSGEDFRIYTSGTARRK